MVDYWEIAGVKREKGTKCKFPAMELLIIGNEMNVKDMKKAKKNTVLESTDRTQRSKSIIAFYFEYSIITGLVFSLLSRGSL